MRFNKNIKIGNRRISEKAPCYIIAEAGVNHNGRVDVAKRLIDAAAKAGADAVKFQMFRTEEIILKNVKKAPYQEKAVIEKEDQFRMLKSLELDFSSHQKLYEHCKKRKITYLCTPYDAVSLNNVVELGVRAIKIASTDLTNLFLLEKAAEKGLPIILATGMSDGTEVRKACAHIYNKGCRDLILLHCTSNYPVGPEEVNLRAMATLAYEFGVLTGFSDHTEGVGAAPYAIPLNACLIEKHFTLDKSMDGPDHRASLEPGEFKKLIASIRYAEKILGSDKKVVTRSESITKRLLQKYVIAKRDIKKGAEIVLSDLDAKRTGGSGVSPLSRGLLIGKKALRDIAKDEPIPLSHVR
ncbi:MAG: N-acetylneuraminate synthase family protein [Candidatus Omnitrophica bacterium]|nr:N-acetylneuraminate synthase family protein [Candidatus Omnitrophota bacterium]